MQFTIISLLHMTYTYDICILMIFMLYSQIAKRDSAYETN